MTITDAPLAGAGRPKGSKELPKFGKDDDKEHALLRVRNKDNLCLFKAVVIAIAYLLAPRKAGAYDFIRLLDNDDDQRKRATELMQNCGITRDLSAYSVSDLKAVQDYLNKRYHEEFRILVFSADSDDRRLLRESKAYKIYLASKPVFNEGVNARQPLVLWHEDGHFDAAKTPEKLLATRRGYNYCAECEVTYDRVKNHSQHCPIRCRLCLGHGHGYPKRCSTNDVKQRRDCTVCRHTFQTAECFERHLKTACRIFHYCIECGHSYRVDKRTPHCCHFERCRKCHQYSPEDHQCHITAEKWLKKKKEDGRIQSSRLRRRVENH